MQEAILFKFRLWKRFLQFIVCRLNHYAKREFQLRYNLLPIGQIEYYMRVTYHDSRQVCDTRYESMKEIVEYVYYNIPNSPSYTYSLVCKHKDTGKEYLLLLRHNQLNPQLSLV